MNVITHVDPYKVLLQEFFHFDRRFVIDEWYRSGT